MRFTVVAIPDEVDGGYAAYVPAIPNCFTQGRTLDEALARAADAAAALLSSMAAHDEDLPTEAPGTVISTVDVPISNRKEAAA